ncbi:MAG: bifunctional folylpolyglutamate synthase/dihydrofolate synthase [Saprospiraceae bacterium]|nr:bifunctional folylpolyglutamate synthase/dihydrofolate synthase [Saprospiraceae bacterium]
MFQRQGPIAYKKDLGNTLKLCEIAGNPHHYLKCVHIAGTNGKGTVSHIIAAGLQAQGYKVGVYTSPHYKDFRERIKINGQFISKTYIKFFINQYFNEIEAIKPSFFEMTVCLAFKYFNDKKVDFAIIETGLGGRLDSTNVITPLLSVITNISYDHQNLLGNTLAEIAIEKAGIIKPGIPVIVGETQPEIKEVFAQKASDCNSAIHFADQNTQLKINEISESGILDYSVTIDNKKLISNLKTDLIGPFQKKNIISALFALHLLKKIIPIDFDKVSKAFINLKKDTHYIGRWQKLNETPLTIADSAHNEGGLKIVFDEITLLKYHKSHIVLGFVDDKDVDKVLQLFPSDAIYYFAKANIPRGMEAKKLQLIAGQSGLKGKAYVSVKNALGAAERSASSDDLILICGSIFVVAEVI